MRYQQASRGQVSYGVEGTAYEKAASADVYFGVMTEAVTFPDMNPMTPLPTSGGRRAPYTHSPDERDLSFDVPFIVLDGKAPFQAALGKKTTTTPAGHTKHLYTEEDILPTLTVKHVHEDLALQQWFIGAKSGLNLKAAQGESVQASMPFVAAKHDYTEGPFVRADLAVPKKAPFRFWMLGDVILQTPPGGATIKTLATVHSFDLTWDNGNEANHHGKGRDAYSVSEETAAEKYDMTVGVTILDRDLWKRAVADEARVDVEIPILRDLAATTAASNDALIVRLKECKVLSAPVNHAASGKLQSDVKLAPVNTEIEIRDPA